MNQSFRCNHDALVHIEVSEDAEFLAAYFFSTAVGKRNLETHRIDLSSTEFEWLAADFHVFRDVEIMTDLCATEDGANPGMSPIAIVVADMHPWKKAEQVADQIPNSDVMIGHGDVMLPLYSDGTVLVLQRLQLEHLRSRMTVVIQARRDTAFDLRATVLIKQHEDGRWEFATAEENAVHHFMYLSGENYLGTVVAALARASEEQKIMQREFVVGSSNLNCTIQCHIAGEIHPLLVPGVKPKITIFDLSKDK